MRVIEQQMCDAIRARKSWSSGNTRVYINADHPELWSVTLHGNTIAAGSFNRTGGYLQVTLAGWPTVTTRSRVNAILRAFAQGGASVYQSKGAQFFHQWGKDVEIGASEWQQPTTGGEHYAAAAAQVQL